MSLFSVCISVSEYILRLPWQYDNADHVVFVEE